MHQDATAGYPVIGHSCIGIIHGPHGCEPSRDAQLRVAGRPSGRFVLSCNALCVPQSGTPVCTFGENTPVKPEILQYLNRLSDYYFVLSRQLAKDLGAQGIAPETPGLSPIPIPPCFSSSSKSDASGASERNILFLRTFKTRLLPTRRLLCTGPLNWRSI